MKKFLVLFAGAWLAGACTVTGPKAAVGGRCTSNSDCSGALECVNDMCTVIGGSDGGADSGTTSGSGGGDSSGAGSSSGLGTSGGASSGSSSGSSGGSQVRFINAAPSTSAGRSIAALDLCVKTTSAATYGTAGISGAAGVAYGKGSDLEVVASAKVNLRVQAAGGNCSDATKLFDLATSVDMSDAGTFSVVAFGDATTAVTGVSVVESVAPTTATNAHVSVVHAMLNQSLVAVTAPSLSLAPSLAVGAISKKDVAPIANQSLTVQQTTNPLGHSFVFDGISLAAASQTTIVALGDAFATDARSPALLVCNDTKAAGGCTTVSAERQAYLRFADMSDAGAAAGFTLCMRDHTIPGGAFSAFATAAFSATAKMVTGFKTHKLNTPAVDFVVVAAAGTQAAPTAGDCTAASVASATVTLTPGAYTTAALSRGSVLTMVPTRPAATVTNTVALTMFNGLVLNDNSSFGSVKVSLPELFGKSLADSVAGSAFAALDLPTVYVAQLQNRSLRVASTAVNGDLHVDRISASISVPTTTSGVSIWAAGHASTTGEPLVIVCADDGSVGGDSNSVCTTSSTTTFSYGVPYGRLRVANLSAHAGTIDLCLGNSAATAPTFTGIAPGQVSAFEGGATVNATTHIYAVPTGQGCDHASSIVTDALTLTDPHYYTAFITGDITSAIDVQAQTPPATATTTAAVNFVNAWDGSLTSALSLDTHAVGSVTFAAVQANVYNTFTPPASTLALTSTGPQAGPFSFQVSEATTAPAVVGGAYEAIAYTKDAGHPQILWCNDQARDSVGNTACDPLITTTP